MNNDTVVKIDVEQVLSERLPKFRRFIPRSAVEWLKQTIRQDQMNELLEQTAGLKGADFCRGILKALQITVDVKYPERLPAPSDRRVVFVSNHPLGGLDGLALIALIQEHYGGQVWFVVNDLLTAVKPLESVFLPINKFGKQSRRSLEAIEKAFAGPDPIIMFPAGMVSRLRKVPFNGQTVEMVRDLEWQKMFVTRAVQSHRDIVPLFFSGTNSMDFYKKANLRKKLGLRLNLEMILLPRELLYNKGKSFSVTVGDRQPYGSIDKSDARGYAQAIGSMVYMLNTETAENAPLQSAAGETESL